MKSILIFFLNLLSRLYIWRYKPQIVAVTGNVGKSSTKEAIGVVLSKIKKIRVAGGNLNNEFGLPLSILGDWSGEYYNEGPGLKFWLKVLVLGFLELFWQKNYPEILVLEYGADKPGDIKRLAKKYKPRVGVVTMIGEIPVHVEFFSNREDVAREKSKLVEALDSTGYAVLNLDDLEVLEMKEKTKAKVWTYGFTDGASVRISNFGFHLEGERPRGISFKLNYGGGFVPVILSDSLGQGAAAAAAAAAAVGLIYGMNLIEISEALSNFKSPLGRLKLLKGIKDSLIIDDTYNASPASTHLALETLRNLPGKRKIAILGDMLELGKYSIQAHQNMGNLAATFVDILVTVGLRAKFIADAAANQIAKEKIITFETSDEAKSKIQRLIKEGDLVLVKGSQGMRMEKIVQEIMAQPERVKELLVRQSKRWLSK